MTVARSLGVVIVAAGSGVRFGDAGKALALLGGKPLLAWSLDLFASLPDVRQIVVVAGAHTRARCEELADRLAARCVTVVDGGLTRAESVRAGLAVLNADIAYVAVHDAARPLVTEAVVQRAIEAAYETGAAVPVIPVSDTLHVAGPDGMVASTPDRSQFRAAQTPQIARRDWLDAAYQTAAGTTDEAGLLRAAGYPVRLVDGDPRNLKITWPADLALAEALLADHGEGQ